MKTKGARKITFPEFQKAMEAVAAKKVRTVLKAAARMSRPCQAGAER